MLMYLPMSAIAASLTVLILPKKMATLGLSFLIGLGVSYQNMTFQKKCQVFKNKMYSLPYNTSLSFNQVRFTR